MKILLAYDGSQHAQAAIKMMGDLALPPRSHVHLLQVFPPGQTSVVAQLEHALEAAKEELLSHHINADAELLLGYPAEKIVDTATEMKPDLIVIGAKGLRATLGILLGGVVQQVVEYACCPTLIVRAPYHGLRHILLVSDGSLYSQRTARFLGEFPIPEKTEIGVLHALAPVPHQVIIGGWQEVPYPVQMMEETELEMEKQADIGKALLERTCNLLQEKGLESTPILVRGDAATEIINYANNEDVDLIVAGSRGLSSFRGWLMGSVSRKLVHYATCSVLIVRQPKPYGGCPERATPDQVHYCPIF
jgi:nucleotide-binding universal stress UspA family protein